jgi:nucleotide-binding universal stress UspA family protein
VIRYRQEESTMTPQPVLVGITRRQDDRVLRTAAEYTRLRGAALLVAIVDASRYTVDVDESGRVVSAPVDPDGGFEESSILLAHVTERTRWVSESTGVEAEAHLLAGGVPEALADLARRRDAALIVVGTSDSSFRSGMHAFFTGSVATHLAHHQERPLLVVPSTRA